MKTLAAILAGAALTLAGTAASAATTAEKGEERLARILEGRTAGEPVSCITTMRNNELQVIDEVGLVYEAGDTVYVARPVDPRMLRRTDALVIDRFSPSRLCVNEPIRSVNRHGGFFTGVVFLNDFVPYKKG
jgi:hypothetical protein